MNSSSRSSVCYKCNQVDLCLWFVLPSNAGPLFFSQVILPANVRMVMVETVSTALGRSDESNRWVFFQEVVEVVDSDLAQVSSFEKSLCKKTTTTLFWIGGFRGGSSFDGRDFHRVVFHPVWTCDVILGGARRGGFGGPSSSFDRPPARW